MSSSCFSRPTENYEESFHYNAKIKRSKPANIGLCTLQENKLVLTKTETNKLKKGRHLSNISPSVCISHLSEWESMQTSYIMHNSRCGRHLRTDNREAQMLVKLHNQRPTCLPTELSNVSSFQGQVPETKLFLGESWLEGGVGKCWTATPEWLCTPFDSESCRRKVSQQCLFWSAETTKCFHEKIHIHESFRPKEDLQKHGTRLE